MSRTYYVEKTKEIPEGYVTMCEQMQKGHIPLAVLWSPFATKRYCIMYDKDIIYCSDVKEVYLQCTGRGLTPPEEVCKLYKKNTYADMARICDEIRDGLIKAPPHLTKNGIYDSDKVKPGIVEGAIFYLGICASMLRSS